MMHSFTLPGKMLPVLLLLLLLAVLPPRVCRAGAAADAMLLTGGTSPVDLLRQDNMQWRAAWRDGAADGEWEDVGAAAVSAPAGERAVTLSMAGRIAALLCEESRRSVGGVTRGRCALRPSHAHAPAAGWGEVFFTYRVAQRGAAAHSSTLYGEGGRDDDDDVGEVGTVTYVKEEEELDDGSVVLQLALAPGEAGQESHAGWLPGTLRLTGLSVHEVARRNWKRRAASSLVGRWGFPLLAVLLLYGGLFMLDWLVARKRSQAAKLKRE